MQKIAKKLPRICVAILILFATNLGNWYHPVKTPLKIVSVKLCSVCKSTVFPHNFTHQQLLQCFLMAHCDCQIDLLIIAAGKFYS